MKNTFFDKIGLFACPEALPPKAIPEIVPAKKGGQAIKSVTYAGIYLVLNSLALDYMSGEELLTYIKGNLTIIAASTSSAFRGESAEDGCSSNTDTPALNPVELVKQIGSMFNKKMVRAA